MSETGKNAITDDMLLMYPQPTVFSKHTVVPLSDAGKRIGELMISDPRLASLSAKYGFRPADASVFSETLKANGLAVPPSLVNVIEPPSYETLESMITEIATRYDTPPPATTDVNG
jgi:hypothetical protein